MWKPARKPRALACRFPRTSEVSDWLTFTMEHPRDNLSPRLLYRLCVIMLAFKNVPKLRNQRELPPLSILGFPGFEAELAPREIHVSPLAGQ
jgi:hypothetical protein